MNPATILRKATALILSVSLCFFSVVPGTSVPVVFAEEQMPNGMFAMTGACDPADTSCASRHVPTVDALSPIVPYRVLFSSPKEAISAAFPYMRISDVNLKNPRPSQTSECFDAVGASDHRLPISSCSSVTTYDIDFTIRDMSRKYPNLSRRYTAAIDETRIGDVYWVDGFDRHGDGAQPASRVVWSALYDIRELVDINPGDDLASIKAKAQALVEEKKPQIKSALSDLNAELEQVKNLLDDNRSTDDKIESLLAQILAELRRITDATDDPAIRSAVAALYAPLLDETIPNSYARWNNWIRDMRKQAEDIQSLILKNEEGLSQMGALLQTILNANDETVASNVYVELQSLANTLPAYSLFHRPIGIPIIRFGSDDTMTATGHADLSMNFPARVRIMPDSAAVIANMEEVLRKMKAIEIHPIPPVDDLTAIKAKAEAIAQSKLATLQVVMDSLKAELAKNEAQQREDQEVDTTIQALYNQILNLSKRFTELADANPEIPQALRSEVKELLLRLGPFFRDPLPTKGDYQELQTLETNFRLPDSSYASWTRYLSSLGDLIYSLGIPIEQNQKVVDQINGVMDLLRATNDAREAQSLLDKLNRIPVPYRPLGKEPFLDAPHPRAWDTAGDSAEADSMSRIYRPVFQLARPEPAFVIKGMTYILDGIQKIYDQALVIIGEPPVGATLAIIKAKAEAIAQSKLATLQKEIDSLEAQLAKLAPLFNQNKPYDDQIQAQYQSIVKLYNEFLALANAHEEIPESLRIEAKLVFNQLTLGNSNPGWKFPSWPLKNSQDESFSDSINMPVESTDIAVVATFAAWNAWFGALRLQIDSLQNYLEQNLKLKDELNGLLAQIRVATDVQQVQGLLNEMQNLRVPYISALVTRVYIPPGQAPAKMPDPKLVLQGMVAIERSLKQIYDKAFDLVRNRKRA